MDKSYILKSNKQNHLYSIKKNTNKKWRPYKNFRNRKPLTLGDFILTHSLVNRL